MTDRADIPWSTFFRLSPSSGRSLQVQIRQAIVAAVEERRLSTGAQLPASRDLALHLGVARNTVVLAYQQLVDDGILVSRRRSGTFVADDARSGAQALCPATEWHAAEWSRRIGRLPSHDRNITKPKNWLEQPYPFLYGQFDPSIFPINAWRECARMALSVLEIRDWAPDSIDGDDPELIEQLRLHVLPRRGLWASPDEIIVTLGAQQALFLLAELLATHGSTVGVEDPGYPDARNIFRRKAAQVRSLPVDGDGLVPSEAYCGCDLVYLTPSSHCPTTIATPMERRLELIELARRHGIVLIEDDYETEFRDGAPPALKSLDRDGRVLYVGSLSKVLAPGLRLGYVVAPKPVVRELRALRRLMLRHPPANNQRTAAIFLSLGHYNSHLRHVREGLCRRAALVEEGLRQGFSGFHHRLGGSSAWVEGPPGFCARELARRAERRGILIEPGDVFFAADDPPRNGFRLGFSSIAAERIKGGLDALAETARELKAAVSA